MPAFDKTGPMGKGPKTGRGMGPCGGGGGKGGRRPRRGLIGKGRGRGGRRRGGPTGLLGPGFLRGPRF